MEHLEPTGPASGPRLRVRVTDQLVLAWHCAHMRDHLSGYCTASGLTNVKRLGTRFFLELSKIQEKRWPVSFLRLGGQGHRAQFIRVPRAQTACHCLVSSLSKALGARLASYVRPDHVLPECARNLKSAGKIAFPARAV